MPQLSKVFHGGIYISFLVFYLVENKKGKFKNLYLVLVRWLSALPLDLGEQAHGAFYGGQDVEGRRQG